jgi:hypothetical protein
MTAPVYAGELDPLDARRKDLAMYQHELERMRAAESATRANLKAFERVAGPLAHDSDADLRVSIQEDLNEFRSRIEVLETATVDLRAEIEFREAKLEASREMASQAQICVQPAALSRRLVEFASHALPAGDRADYAELFHSELFDLAQTGCGRRAQVMHALRVLVRILALRRALRSAPAFQERSW